MMRMQRQSHSIALGPLYALLNDGSNFDQERFDAAYADAEMGWYAESIEYVAVAPLIGVKVEDEVTVGPNLKIVRFSPKEVSSYPFQYSPLHEPRAALQVRFSAPVVVGEIEEQGGVDSAAS